MKTRSILTIFLGMLLASGNPMMAQRLEEPVNLEKVYKQIDEAIEMSPQYVQHRVDQIDKQRKSLNETTRLEDRFLIAEELFALFKPYKNDSALHYAQMCVSLADSIQRPDLAGLYRALMARQCSNAGMYVESTKILQRIDKSALDQQGLTDYYDAYMHVCGEVAAYTLIPRVRDYFYAEQDHYRDSVLLVADKGGDEYLHLLMSALVARKDFQQALKVSDKWINMTTEGTHADAYAAYFRHILYAQMGNEEMSRFWVAKSALDDIKCGVMDQAALINLAELLNRDGDLKRSYRYIRFTWDCNQFFNTRMRSSQISPVLNVIEKNYQDTIEKTTRYLAVSAIVFCVMTVLLCVFFLKLRRQKRKLTAAQKELEESNKRYADVNRRLQKMNDKVMENNKKLFEINHKLQENQMNHNDD